MTLTTRIKDLSEQALKTLYDFQPPKETIQINQCKPEFEGDYTLVLFPFIKQLKKSPEQLGKEIGEHLVKTHPDLFTGFNVIKGFLNLTIKDDFWIEFLEKNYSDPEYGKKPFSGQRIMVEYSSPNTNKPLHLGHLRNNFLGWSIAEILKANGYDVVKTCIINDRGIHICKSMLAWKKYGSGETPQSTGIKGDHFVGKYYVMFEKDLKEQAQPIIDKIRANDISGFDPDDQEELQNILNAKQKTTDPEKLKKINDEIVEIARNNTAIMKEAKNMLRDWEAGVPEVIGLWKKMNGWVYEGFDETYQRIGSDFQKIYYESDTYLLGRQFVEEGLKAGVFFRKEDGSVWIDLTAEGLDHKLVLRKDGTSVYITQDIGLADQKYEQYNYVQSIYVIADEQNYHMKVLKLILEKMGKPYAKGVHHMSYGMVELPTGRMKSREGTVVDADDIIDEMVEVARKKTEELGKVKDFPESELHELYDTIGLGALKFFLLRVDPKKRMVFNPEESIDFHGFTGPFVQYSHARIMSILKKEADSGKQAVNEIKATALLPLEKNLIVMLEQYRDLVEESAADHNPSLLAIYIFNLAKSYNTFYTEHSVINAESEEKKSLRLKLSEMTANVIASAMGLLGIRVPDRM